MTTTIDAKSPRALRRRAWLATAAGVAASPLVGYGAETYPARPIRLVVPYGPGGTTGPMARLLGEGIAANLQTTAFVDHRPGAGGLIAFNTVINAPADGYTLLYGGAVLHNVFTLKIAAYDPFKDFQAVARVCDVPLVFSVSASLGVKTLDEFIAWARRKGGFSLGTWGLGSTAHLFASELASKTQLTFIHATYKGEAPVLSDVMGGAVDSGFFSFTAAAPHAGGGKIVLLAATGEKRSPLAPEVPTFTELGMQGFEINPYHGVFFGGGVSDDIVRQVSQEAVNVMSDPKVVSVVERMGLIPAPLGREAFVPFLRKDYAAIGALMRKYRIEPQ